MIQSDIQLKFLCQNPALFNGIFCMNSVYVVFFTIEERLQLIKIVSTYTILLYANQKGGGLITILKPATGGSLVYVVSF